MFYFFNLNPYKFYYMLFYAVFASTHILYMAIWILICHFLQSQCNKSSWLKKQNLRNITYLMNTHSLLFKDLVFTVID